MSKIQRIRSDRRITDSPVDLQKISRRKSIMFKMKFLGNTRIPHHKNTSGIAPVRMTPPAEVCIPMLQHIGAPATPIVKVGDEVKVGQLIAEASGYVSAPIHASVSGKVSKIDECLRLNGKTVPAIRIVSDGEMSVYEGLTPPSITDVDSLLEAVRTSGLVGLGGAGFPTAVKLDAVKKGGINTIVINAAECEPYITSDARTMLDRSDDIKSGIELLKSVLDVKNYVIGIESNKPECIKKMESIFNGDSAVKVQALPSLYPQGAEKVLIKNTTGLVVPEGKLPADVGVLVMNVTTLAALAKYAKTGMPLVEKCITVDGSAIKEPKNVIVPIGTSIGDVIEFTGGFSCEPGKVIFGGPMTGLPAHSLSEPVIKNNNAVLAFAPADSHVKKTGACIHCGRCVEACPHFLNPVNFNRAMSIESLAEKVERLEEESINLCMECGSCAFVCPAGRPLIENNRLAKALVRDYKEHQSSLK